jgi:hypothetical protein
MLVVIRKLVRSLEKEELEIWAMPSWAIWYDGKDPNLTQVFEKGSSLREF